MTPQALGRAVRLEGLGKSYAGKPVVQGVDLAIEAGEFFALLGPSGSGKTTTLTMIAGFTEPDAGAIRFAGEDVTRLPAQKRGLGMVIQNYALFPHLSVFENIAFPLRIRRRPPLEVGTRVEEALAAVRLTGMGSRRPRELSGGQQQRVALARAVVFRPGVVLMDEPLGALDKNLRLEMQAEIKDLQRRLGVTVVYVTHDQEEAMAMSDRLAIMDAGRIVQCGPPREVYERPSSAFAARFLGDANLLAGRVGDGSFVTAGGRTLPAPPGGDGLALLCVRPEKVALHAPGEAAGRGLAGRVSRVVFLGGNVRYEVAAGEPGPLIADAPTDGRPIWAEGAEVSVVWSPDAAVRLPPEPAA